MLYEVITAVKAGTGNPGYDSGRPSTNQKFEGMCLKLLLAIKNPLIKCYLKIFMRVYIKLKCTKTTIVNLITQTGRISMQYDCSV